MSELHNRLTTSIPIAGILCDDGPERGYRMVAEGILPIIPGSGVGRVAVAKLELLLGRRLTAADFAAAEAKYAPTQARKSEAARRCRAKKKAAG